MGDAKRSNENGLSPEDQQYLEDLETAKRMSLECFDSEQRLRKGYLVFSSEQQNMITRKLSHPDGSGVSDDKIRPLRPALDIKSRPRPFSRAASAGSSQSASVVSPPPASTNIASTKIATSIPPPAAFKRQRSLPHRYRHSAACSDTSPVNNTQSNSPPPPNSTNSNNQHNGKYNPNDDLILLASPKVTPKFDQRGNRSFCDNAYAIPLDVTPMNLTPKSNTSSPGMTTSSSFPARTVLGIPRNNGQIHSPNNSPLRPSIPGLISYHPIPLQVALSTQPASTSTVIGGILNNISRYNFIPNAGDTPPANHIPSHFRNAQSHAHGQSPISFATPPLNSLGQNRGESNTPSPVSPAEPSSSTNLYRRVSDELKFISPGNPEDLIDFGIDSKNILEYFDPLIIKERWIEEQELKKRTELEKPKFSSPQQVSIIDSIYNTSIGSGVSTATSAFSFKRGSGGPQSLSLYPSLEEFECESLYANLQAGQDGRHNSDASSFYDAYNPFEYLYTVSCSSPSASSAYETFSLASQQPINSNGTTLRSIGFSHYLDQLPTPAIPPALPPRNAEPSSQTSSPTGTLSRIQFRTRTQSYDKSKRSGKLYENIESIKHFSSMDSEIQGFYEMIRELRFSFRHVDSASNKGFIRSSTLETQCCNKGFSVKIIVWPESSPSEPATFTSEISGGIEMIVEQSIMELQMAASARDYILRVKGLNEYLDTEVPLSHYRYVQQCIKLDQDIQLVLMKRSSLDKNSWARTPKDDARAVSISIDDILPRVQSKTINYADISIPLEVIDRESDRIKEKLILQLHGSNNNNAKDSGISFLSPAPITQPVKAVCVLLGEVVTVEIVNSLNLFIKACDEWNAKMKVSSPVDRSFDPEFRRRPKVGSDASISHSYVEILPVQKSSKNVSLKDFVMSAIDKVTDSVRSLVEMYSKSFPVSFRMKEIVDKTRQECKDNYKPMADMIESFILRIGAVHRLKPDWLMTYTNYVLTVDVFHGTRWMAKATTGVVNVVKAENHWFFNTIVVDSWVNFEHLPVCILPRESRIVLTLFGRKPTEDNSPNFETVELGWTSMQCFNFKGMLAQGTYLLPFWSVGLVQKRLGPAPNSSFSSDANAPLLTIEFTDFGYDLLFPEIPSAVPIPREFQTLDNNTQLMLKDIVENSTFTKFPAEDREVLWEKRHYLHEYPNALPKVLLSAQLWDWASLAELHAMLQHWHPLDPVDALQLLLPCFPDARVREEGISWISYMSDEELINLLPQLVEALSYETFDLSPLARFLLKKSLCSLQIAHYLFWLLASQVGLGKWTSSEQHCDPVISRLPKIETENAYDPKRRRLELMLNSLMTISGEKLKWGLISQFKMIEGFSDVALQVKATSKDSARTAILVIELLKVNSNVFGSGASFPLPISPSTDVIGIDARACSYYNSNALPLKLTFKNGLPEGDSVSAIYKLGDDLRQDILTIQTIRVIEKWWLKDGLDLRVLTFSCVPTGYKQGLVEMVPNAETLCKIQAEHGVTGVFRDSAIAEWLAKMNPSTLDYRRAIDNFTLSCAAYCVVTYILGICDRHNDNIMLTKKGHLFHIDFGKFLGDAQMFINFKRDRTPFVLTSDMVYVINDGEKGSHRFHRFVELCCKAFRIIRKNGNVLLNLFALMATAGIPGVDLNSVSYIQKALLPECSNVEAAARFTRFIEESSQNWFTPVNFFLHSLAQLRFSSESTDDPTTLSFVPTIYTMELDGRIEKAMIVSYQKKYDPEKYYVYTIKVKRKAQTEWSILHRSYKEFLEFHTKLCINFPKAVGTLKALQRGSGIGRSNVKQVAQKRRFLIQLFLDSLFTLADEISHSKLVYTFFHPLLRDEEQHLDDEFDRKTSALASLSKSPSRIHGQVKLSIEYQRGALLVLIQHAVDLACPNGQPPSPYVKTYLQPDNSRVTKRKTRVVRRSQHPTFMEMIEYRLPLEIIRMKSLQVSVWHQDSLQENNFLGGVSIVLRTLVLEKETTETYILGNITSTA